MWSRGAYTSYNIFYMVFIKKKHFFAAVLYLHGCCLFETNKKYYFFAYRYIIRDAMRAHTWWQVSLVISHSNVENTTPGYENCLCWPHGKFIKLILANIYFTLYAECLQKLNKRIIKHHKYEQIMYYYYKALRCVELGPVVMSVRSCSTKQ